MKRYGYHRTSTREQHLDRGIKEITTYCEQKNLELEKIFTDQQTGKNFNRPRYQVLKEDVLRAGDELIITEVGGLFTMPFIFWLYSTYLFQTSAHVLRHTFCTRLCENETNLKVIMDIMGHSDIRTTMNIYAEVTGVKKQESMMALSDKILV